MPEFNIGSFTFGKLFWEATYVVGLMLLSGILAWITRKFMTRMGHVMSRRLKSQLGKRLVQAISTPVVLLVLASGLLLTTTIVNSLAPWHQQARSIWGVVAIVLVALSFSRLSNEFLSWYSRYQASRERSAIDRRLIPALKRLTTIIVYLLGTLLILDQIDVSISPLLAGFGIGGLAVALALQPTLSNFFAGTYLVSDRVISPGDFIQLENGLQGYIVEVGWRSARIHTLHNNLMTIPNSRLADSILTNYYGPTMQIGVMVEAGVSYSSDLQHVEQVVREVARGVIEELPQADKGFEPWFGYERFGDSNIDFWIWVQARDRVASFALKSELIKRIHNRFIEEGIDINYPVRKLVLPKRDSQTEPLLLDQEEAEAE